ncbi:monooxygenase [Kosakonia sp. H02]|nr:monooxygenase [Kosakonia sp. H02]
MTNKLLQVHFEFNGPFGSDMSEQLVELAESINREPGFIWKIWTENATSHEAGSIYLFDSEENAQRYLQKHRARLQEFGAKNVTCKLFDINTALTTLTHGQTN